MYFHQEENIFPNWRRLSTIKVIAIVTITYTNRIVCYFQIQSKVSITRIVLFFKVPPSQVAIILSGKVVTIMVHWFTFQNKRSRPLSESNHSQVYRCTILMDRLLRLLRSLTKSLDELLHSRARNQGSYNPASFLQSHSDNLIFD